MPKVIVVTGGAQGIGREIVIDLLSDEGTSVYVIDKQETEFITKCVNDYPERFTYFQQDIADKEGLEVVLGKLQVLSIDGIVNNAGEVYFEEWDALSMDTWDRTLAVNVRAPLHIVHSLRAALKEGASIVNITSTDRDRAAFTTIPYAASKAALANLTMSLAAILGERGIRVNAIAPGWVETEMTKDTMPKEAAWITPLRRNASAVEISRVVKFLLNEEASFITGQTITVDGGLSIVDYTIKSESEK